MKKGITKQIIITVIAVTIGSIFGNLGVEYFLNQNNSFDKQMMKAASELNESCPIMVDTDTRFNHVFHGIDRPLLMTYRAEPKVAA